MTTEPHFGEWVKWCAARMDLKKGELAQAAGIDPKTITNLIRKPTPDGILDTTITRLARVFKMSERQLLERWKTEEFETEPPPLPPPNGTPHPTAAETEPPAGRIGPRTVTVPLAAGPAHALDWLAGERKAPTEAVAAELLTLALKREVERGRGPMWRDAAMSEGPHTDEPPDEEPPAEKPKKPRGPKKG